MENLDFGPATRNLAGLVGGVRHDQLDDPTPCPDWSVGHLLRHGGGLTLEFTASAQKVPTPARAGDGLTGADDDGGLFGPPVPTASDAEGIDRLVGLTGRDPAWQRSAAQTTNR
jgi:Mycothiol maleylpyruvate isomerase N-terminal domain